MRIREQYITKRGYFGIGVYMPKTSENIGTLWRNAYQLGASFIFTIGERYKKQSSDTVKTFRHIPLMQFKSYEDFSKMILYDCQQIVYVEFNETSKDLRYFEHPKRCIYLLGADDFGLPPKISSGEKTISIPSIRTQSYNVATAGAIIMYDRLIKESK